MSVPPHRLAVFARAPQLGKVKTRLCPPLSSRQALELHRALLEDTLERLGHLSGDDLELCLYLSQPLARPSDLNIPRPWEVRTQKGDDLGSRLGHAFQEGFDAGRRAVVILGSDSPTVPVQHVRLAFERLSRSPVVLGPAEDGGYYLIGCSELILDAFVGIRWGSEDVLRQTTEALRRAGRTYEMIPPWYDVDRERDLKRLSEELRRPSAEGSPYFARRTFEVVSRLVQ